MKLADGYLNLTSDQQEALTYLARNAKAFNAVCGLVDDELTLAKQQYERAKDALVATGEGRPVCLHHRGMIAAFEQILRILNSPLEK